MMIVDHVAVGRRIREVREARGISQAAAAEALEISQSTYSRIESGSARSPVMNW